MEHIVAGGLDIGYFESGRADGEAVILLHGFPYDAHAYDHAAVHLAAAGKRVIVPFLRGYGPTRFVDPTTPRSGQQAALAADLLALMDALSIRSAVLGGYDWGGRATCIAAALWPQRVRGLVSCGQGYNIQDIARSGEPATPEDEHLYWYQYYFHGERGRAGLTANRRAFCRLLWRLWSPSWAFDDATFERSAESFDNPDFVAVVIHSYRHRYNLAQGDPAFSAIEAQLAQQPAIAVPTIALHGADDGVDPPTVEDLDIGHFTGPYERRIIAGAGHNLPQEKPMLFAEAVLAVS